MVENWKVRMIRNVVVLLSYVNLPGRCVEFRVNWFLIRFRSTEERDWRSSKCLYVGVFHRITDNETALSCLTTEFDWIGSRVGDLVHGQESCWSPIKRQLAMRLTQVLTLSVSFLEAFLWLLDEVERSEILSDALVTQNTTSSCGTRPIFCESFSSLLYD